MDFHRMSITEIFSILKSCPEGLSASEAASRLSLYGPNTIKDIKKKSPWMIFFGQFNDFMILVLIIASIISGLAGDLTDTIIILLIVMINAITGFVQEYKAEKSLNALKKMTVTQAKVIRGGHHALISSVELVPGDVVIIETGNTIPADLRLLETHNLSINEASLTGESVPVEKITAIISQEQVALGDMRNLAFKGSTVTNGRGKGLVLFTGMNTEIGKIARFLQQNETETPLKRRMTQFSKKLSYIILFISLILFSVGLLRGEGYINMLLLSISLAVAAIPEALPALITIALAKGANRLVGLNALIRKLPAVETLGSVTYICSDKTGTLTVNKMTVHKIKETENAIRISDLTPLTMGMVLNHDVQVNSNTELIGEPTEVALVTNAIKMIGFQDYNAIIEKFPRLDELPFDSARRCMTTIHQLDGKYLILTKGAFESIYERLSVRYKDLNNLNDEWSKGGLRVLAFAYKIIDRLPEKLTHEIIEKDLYFAGLTGLIDPPRNEVKDAVTECKTAGIRTVMITGDHPSTAAAIARETGILSEGDQVLTGVDLNKMEDGPFNEAVEDISVYARVSPDQKLRIIKALQAKNHFVSMTGDGVNDAPSLKAANIGVAMGITGTDVSKEAADMILLDDNFTTIVKAVKEGRRIYDNIRKFIKYIMTCNSAEIWTIFMAPILGMPIPLLPIQILWINLITDGFPGIALASEKAEPDIMKRPPKKANESLFEEGLGIHILWVGILMAGITLATQAWAIHTNNSHWQTMVFTVLSLSQLGHALAIRSERTFLYKQGIFTNMPLLTIVLLTFLLQLGVIYIPFLNDIIHTQSLSFTELCICIGVSAILFHAIEFEKWVKKRVVKPH